MNEVKPVKAKELESFFDDLKEVYLKHELVLLLGAKEYKEDIINTSTPHTYPVEKDSIESLFSVLYCSLEYGVVCGELSCPLKIKTVGNRKLKTLAEHDTSLCEAYRKMNSNEPQLNGIACPKCDSELYDSDPMFVLISSPTKKNIHCSKCDYVGYRVA